MARRPVHGIIFVAYVVIALNVRESARWSKRATLGVLLGAVLPLGGFVVERSPTGDGLDCERRLGGSRASQTVYSEASLT